ncbi:hypothetical protein Tco_0706080 [Tanacetum coccineum]|uniref:Uncharacterized protein n=1 Tax=Tanacetum coccineum TaxID=301880 RepID=A0ABQ4Y6E2_9ASTR
MQDLWRVPAGSLLSLELWSSMFEASLAALGASIELLLPPGDLPQGIFVCTCGVPNGGASGLVWEGMMGGGNGSEWEVDAASALSWIIVAR